MRFLTTHCGAMKRFIAITAIVAATLGLFSCEKHSWDKETKKLYEHGDHGSHEEGAEHKDHGHEEGADHDH